MYSYDQRREVIRFYIKYNFQVNLLITMFSFFISIYSYFILLKQGKKGYNRTNVLVGKGRHIKDRHIKDLKYKNMLNAYYTFGNS